MKQGKSALSIVKKYRPAVVRVVDAKSPLRVLVTKEDCKSSTKKSPDACAMAKARERNYDGAIISTTVAYIVKGYTATRYKVPQSVQRELVSFDRNKVFAPGEYILNNPSESTKLHPRKPRTRPADRHAKKYDRNKKRNHHTAGIRSL